MTATIMDGKGVATGIRARIKAEVRRLEDNGTEPCLATILVGSDEASSLYVSLKHNACQETGIKSMDHRFPEDVTEEEMIEKIEELNGDDNIHGVLVQLPLPEKVEPQRILEKILPEKDVDGLGPSNLGRTFFRRYGLLPCTPAGIMVLLSRYAIDSRGAYIVIVNRSTEVGKPLAQLLLNRDATVTVCHSKTREIEKHTRSADILISAVGKRPDFLIGEEMVKPGAAVIDVGMNRIGGKLYGDVDFERVVHKASYITPVPGGVGPMTIAMLLRNTLAAASTKTGMEIAESLTFDRELSNLT